MLKREEWLDLTRKLDWPLSYVTQEEAFPPEIAGDPERLGGAVVEWEEPFHTAYGEYVIQQNAKEVALEAVHETVGTLEDYKKLDKGWLAGEKLHAATLPLAEFAAVIGNLRAARFARNSAWRSTALFGALDELRHTQIPLLLMHDLVKWDPQFNWTHQFFHTNDWVAIAGRHFVDELLLGCDPIEFAIATNFVFETGFTNLQFIGLAAVAHQVGDKMFEKMLSSIQTDEARHAQIGPAVLRLLVQRDRKYAQYLLDKWFWRSWIFFAIVTGFTMDYLTPLAHRKKSFKEFMEEWVLNQFERSLAEYGLQRPWYWEQFIAALENYHHMVYVSAYTYRASVWFDFVLPGPKERAWLKEKYPATFGQFDPIWQRLSDRWQACGPTVEWYTHGTTPVGFCDLCQIVLSAGTPQKNTAQVFEHNHRKYIFCSEPCRWIFTQEPKRYENHLDVVKRILKGDAPANLAALVHDYFGLTQDMWGKDVYSGDYDFAQPKGK